MARTAFMYSDDFLKYQFGPFHPFQPIREKLTLDTLAKTSVFDRAATLVRPDPVSMQVLQLVHTEKYIDYVKRMCDKGVGTLDTGDTPAVKGLYEGSLAAVGGSVDGAAGIAEGKFEHAFNPAGGLHHAHPSFASGFCVFNDVAVAARLLQRKYGYQKVAIIDIDGHHGDGTQHVFYNEPTLTVSLHRHGFGFFPGSGSDIEVGEGKGKGYSINVPLPQGTSDDDYLYAYKEIVIPALKQYKPDFIIHQCGADSHFSDPLVGLGLSTYGYQKLAKITHDAAHEHCGGRYLMVGGGGYNIDAVRRIWSVIFLTVSGIEGSEVDSLHDEKTPPANSRAGEIVHDLVERIKENSLSLLEEKVRS